VKVFEELPEDHPVNRRPFPLRVDADGGVHDGNDIRPRFERKVNQGKHQGNRI
jgi:hypothetical protein